ncbi:MAG: complex I NDUFA9 subunit family protein [Rhodoferax sp.]|nr:complex I NDUFA9 subunit family protein [Rhodoferax sp.]
MKNVLVLGGTGFVGTHVCEKLVRAGYTVTVPTRRWNNAQDVLHLPSLTVRELDVHDATALARAAEGHDAVVNLVAILHGDQAAFNKVHVELPQKIAAACASAGVAQLVHISALGANVQKPASLPSMYLRSKSLGEAILLASCGQMALTILRPSVIFGAGDKFLNLFASLQKIAPFVPLAGADARFQPVWVEDVAAAVVKSLERSSPGVQTLEACGPGVFTLKALVELSARLAGVNEGRGRPVLGLPQWAGALQARLMELKPGVPLMSRDNLDSMRVPNVATPGMPGLEALGIQPAALEPVARDYLSQGSPWHDLLGVRLRSHWK